VRASDCSSDAGLDTQHSSVITLETLLRSGKFAIRVVARRDLGERWSPVIDYQLLRYMHTHQPVLWALLYMNINFCCVGEVDNIYIADTARRIRLSHMLQTEHGECVGSCHSCSLGYVFQQYSACSYPYTLRIQLDASDCRICCRLSTESV